VKNDPQPIARWFVPGGFAVVSPDNIASITAPDAIPLEDLDVAKSTLFLLFVCWLFGCCLVALLLVWLVCLLLVCLFCLLCVCCVFVVCLLCVCCVFVVCWLCVRCLFVGCVFVVCLFVCWLFVIGRCRCWSLLVVCCICVGLCVVSVCCVLLCCFFCVCVVVFCCRVLLCCCVLFVLVCFCRGGWRCCSCRRSSGEFLSGFFSPLLCCRAHAEIAKVKVLAESGSSPEAKVFIHSSYFRVFRLEEIVENLFLRFRRLRKFSWRRWMPSRELSFEKHTH